MAITLKCGSAFQTRDLVSLLVGDEFSFFYNADTDEVVVAAENLTDLRGRIHNWDLERDHKPYKVKFTQENKSYDSYGNSWIEIIQS